MMLNPQECYVDGFVIAIKKANVEAYKKMATDAGKIWMKHGALQYVECIGDDLSPAVPEEMAEQNVDMPKMLGFPTMINMKEDETVLFSFITYKDRAHRDEVNAKVMADPAMNDEANWPKEMPFTMDRMSFGGFKTIVNYEAN